MRSGRSFQLRHAQEIGTSAEHAYAVWTRFEELPRALDSVRRVKCIDSARLLWDADVFGCQVVWEARIVEAEPSRRLHWDSTWGARHRGELRFERLPGGRTRLVVEIEYRPQGLVQHVGARLGLVALSVERDLACFARAVERASRSSARRPATHRGVAHVRGGAKWAARSHRS